MSKTKRQPGRQQKPRDEGSGGTLGEWVRVILIWGSLFLLIRFFVLQTFVIISGSMQDTLLLGDFLVVNRAAIGSPVPGTSLRIPGYSTPRRFDILVFDPPHEENMMLVKRLIGMPGDTLEMRGKTLYMNGSVADEPYARHIEQIPDHSDIRMTWQIPYLVSGEDAESYRPSRDNWGPIVIPADNYFMLGDNRDESQDSRYWGLLEGWRLEGRAMFIYYSYERDTMTPFPWIRLIRWDRIGDRIR